jgi:iron complex outermembrane receptor protein
VINFKHSTLNIESARHPLTKAAVITLAIPALALSMITPVTAETVKKSDSKTAKSKTSTAQNVPSSEDRITALDEMTVSDKQSHIDSWLTEDSDAIPVQERTELGKLTKTAPIAGSIIDQQELKTVKYVDILRDQLNRIPGLSMVRNMRIPDGGKPYTNNLIDGMMVSSPQNQNFTFLDQFNPAEIERIEVTRGPGSVLNPSNGIAGAFNLITKDPSKTPEYWLSQEFGTYDFFRTQGSASGTEKTAINDIGYMASFNAMEYNPWKDRTKTHRASATGKLVFHPDEESKLTLRLDHYDVYLENPSSLTKQQFDSNWQQANPSMLNLYQRFEYLTGGATYKRQIGKGGELEVSFIRREQNGIDANPGGGSGASSTTENHIDFSSNSAHVVYKQDFDFVKSRFYVGNDLINDYQYTEVWNRLANSFAPTTLSTKTKFNDTQVAPFVQYEFSPLNGLFKEGFLSSLDNLRFNYGMRYEDYQQHYQQTAYSTGKPAIKDGGNHYSKLIKKGGLSYEYQKDHILWFGVADGWLVPNTSTNVTSAYPNYGVSPETSITKQLGLRGFFREASLTYDITAYETNIDNYIASVLCSDNPSACGTAWSNLPNTTTTRGVTSVNTAKTTATYTGNPGVLTARGFETALSYQPHEMVKFSVAHTLNWNVWNKYTSGAVNLSRVTQVNAPKHHVNGRVTVYPMKGLNVELETDYISSYQTNIQNTDTYQRPLLFNLRSNYQWKNWTLSLQAINLLNTKYSSRVTANATNVQSYNTLAGVGDGPFQFRAGIDYKF